jgi:putative addiction module component (TIGR02574 family)
VRRFACDDLPFPWDDQAELPITQEQLEELDRRLADYDADPSRGDEWAIVRDRLEKTL